VPTDGCRTNTKDNTMNTKKSRRAPAAGMKKTYVKHADGNSVHWWATRDDLDRLKTSP
jgi:hypothetical protein